MLRKNINSSGDRPGLERGGSETSTAITLHGLQADGLQAAQL